MTRPGVGAMNHALSGGSPKNPSDYYGRTIRAADFDGDRLLLTFEGGPSIKVYDDAQACCESRYMRTDDDVQALVGRTLVAIESNSARYSDTQDEYGNTHEITFLDVKTDTGMVTFSFHNEHNGYYGGFGLSVDEVD